MAANKQRGYLSVGNVFDDLGLRPGHSGGYKVHAVTWDAWGIACAWTPGFTALQPRCTLLLALLLHPDVVCSHYTQCYTTINLKA